MNYLTLLSDNNLILCCKYLGKSCYYCIFCRYIDIITIAKILFTGSTFHNGNNGIIDFYIHNYSNCLYYYMDDYYLGYNKNICSYIEVNNCCICHKIIYIFKSANIYKTFGHECRNYFPRLSW